MRSSRAAIRDYVTLGQNPGDPDPMRDQKAMAVITVLGTMAVTIIYFVSSGRSNFLHVIDGITFVLQVGTIALFWWHRSVARMFYHFVPLYSVITCHNVLLNGTSEGDIMVFVAVPCAALLVFGPVRSVPWCIMSLAVFVMAPLAEPFLPHVQTPFAAGAQNPEGWIYHNPHKSPMRLVEGVSYAVVTFVIYFLLSSLYRQLTLARQLVEEERDKADRLMMSVFPRRVAETLKSTAQSRVLENHAQASVVFADLAGFTRFSQGASARQVFDTLERIFAEFDQITAAHQGEKIKSLGDGYLLAVGLDGADPNHALRACQIALAMVERLHHLNPDLGLRVGIHSGPVVAGVMGRVKPHYDIWGSTVNIAQRLQAGAQTNEIHLSTDTKELLGNALPAFPLKQRELKGIGPTQVWALVQGKVSLT